MIGTILIATPVIEANYRYLKMKGRNMEQYIASYKHLIGCEVHDTDYGNFTICSVSKNYNGGLFFNVNENEPFDSLVSFYLDDENLGTYKEYMQLHYPEYEHIWSKQLMIDGSVVDSIKDLDIKMDVFCKDVWGTVTNTVNDLKNGIV